MLSISRDLLIIHEYQRLDYLGMVLVGRVSTFYIMGIVLYLRKHFVLITFGKIINVITQLSQVNKSETYRCIKIAKGFRKSRKISIFVVSTNKAPNTFSYAQRYINFLRTTRNFPAK